MKLFWAWVAMVELLDGIDYYNAQSAGLGAEFSEEIDAAVEKIMEAPERWGKITEHSRRGAVRRFPYGVIYQILADQVHIIAISNLKRDQSHWRYRERNTEQP